MNYYSYNYNYACKVCKRSSLIAIYLLFTSKSLLFFDVKQKLKVVDNIGKIRNSVYDNFRKQIIQEEVDIYLKPIHVRILCAIEKCLFSYPLI